MPDTDSTPNEIWKPVTGFEGLYEVSNLGRVRRVGYLLKIYNDHYGYKRVTLWKDKKPFQSRVHALVTREFIGPKPNGTLIGHKNHNPADNRCENLEYITQLENIHDSIDSGRWAHKWAGRHKISNRDVMTIRMLKSAGFAQRRIAGWFKTSQGVVSKIVNRLSRNHLDYYVE